MIADILGNFHFLLCVGQNATGEITIPPMEWFHVLQKTCNLTCISKSDLCFSCSSSFPNCKQINDFFVSVAGIYGFLLSRNIDSHPQPPRVCPTPRPPTALYDGVWPSPVRSNRRHYYPMQRKCPGLQGPCEFKVPRILENRSWKLKLAGFASINADWCIIVAD